MDLIKFVKNCEGFDWDQGNIEKNWLKHKVSKVEIEQVFFNQPLILFNDEKHSLDENRFFALGKTNSNRLLTLVFTFRQEKLLRVISARDMSKKERNIYEKSK